ncbi:uncharacterized protein E0L32_004264 [Thyridium curvatum]|uniref:Uncharacterized protein n=1 Tax=Thyridium curvatum TaxID=1093900 RepID=A0A507B8U2_9PEZI|nr:uncharacterized protein E0L32_004264 [Thyridium curvatum]TPX15566.1 hypothetical protein E0L32_004264 [Thyridium curvatum]
MRAALHAKLLAVCAFGAVASMAKPIASRAATDIPTSVRLFTVQAFQSPYPAGEGLTGYVMSVHDGSFWLSAPPLSANNSNTPCLVGGYGRSSTPCVPPPPPRPTQQKSNATETVLWVDGDGKAFLASRKLKISSLLPPLSSICPESFFSTNKKTPPQGHLRYDRPPPARAATAPTPGGAMFALFVHRGHGTAAYTTTTTTTISSSSSSTQQNYTAAAAAEAPPGTFAWVGSEHGLWFACPKGSTAAAAAAAAAAVAEYRLQKMVMGYGDRSLDGCAAVSLAAIDWNGATPVVDAYA